jgi:DNA-binding CsgD family transcriptional regulator
MIQGKRRMIHASDELSKREIHVLGLFAKYGMNSRQVAKALGVSRFTVRTHTESIRWKLGAKTLAQAVFVQFCKDRGGFQSSLSY